ncbi:condensation domain-containing protein [Cantharellus anzutake]|uniref:condensation domain-containing protein n=1 Tax=Cantharellus anzutake TaxID=1750568 RepID=UPI001903DA63|nr:condensation domain-containing protein [Cantharellus anzutake]KAF8341216.1 condensation domain-containing protein [Cantharellus anzutake]
MEWLIASWQRSEGRLFHHAFVFEFEGKMNPGKVRSAWNTLAQHHHILRSTFVPSHVKGSTSYYPVIVSYKHQDPEWLEQSLEANAADELSALKQLLSNAMISLPSIAKVPTRLTYVHGTLQDYFIINLHHFAYDAWSLRLIMNDFRMILNDQSPQFGNNLSGFLFRSEQSETRSEIQRRYWQGLFRNRVSGKLFPHLNRPSCDESSNDNGQIMLRCFVFEDVIHSLESKERRAQELGLPLHLLLLASWGIVQQRYSTSRNAETADGDVVFGLWHSGRLEESEPPSGLDIPNLAVPTVNILPVRVEYHKDSENLVAAAAKNLRLQLQQRSSVIEQSRWVDVVRWIAETQDASHPRLCNVFVNLLKPPHRLEHPLSYSFPSSGSYVSFKAIKFPYSPSSRVKIESSLLRPRYDITEVVQPDLLVDIFLNPANDTIGISFECEHTLVGEDHAKDFVADWATMLDSALR